MYCSWKSRGSSAKGSCGSTEVRHCRLQQWFTTHHSDIFINNCGKKLLRFTVNTLSAAKQRQVWLKALQAPFRCISKCIFKTLCNKATSRTSHTSSSSSRKKTNCRGNEAVKKRLSPWLLSYSASKRRRDGWRPPDWAASSRCSPERREQENIKRPGRAADAWFLFLTWTVCSRIEGLHPGAPSPRRSRDTASGRRPQTGPWPHRTASQSGTMGTWEEKQKHETAKGRGTLDANTPWLFNCSRQLWSCSSIVFLLTLPGFAMLLLPCICLGVVHFKV